MPKLSLAIPSKPHKDSVIEGFRAIDYILKHNIVTMTQLLLKLLYTMFVCHLQIACIIHYMRIE
jgi:hypothetical protein